MRTAHQSFHQELAWATVAVFILGLVCFGLALGSAWMGSTQAVISLRQAGQSVGYAFIVLLTLLCVSSAVGAVRRWIKGDGRSGEAVAPQDEN